MSKTTKKLTKDTIEKINKMYNDDNLSVATIAEHLEIKEIDVVETVYNFTEKEVFKLYYEGLTPRFIALKLGVKESVLQGWFSMKFKEAGYVSGRKSTCYNWAQHKSDLADKGKKFCHTKEEQEAKLNRLLGDDAIKALNREDMLNPDIVTRVANKLGYKTIKGFKRIIQMSGLMTDELRGIFDKM